MSNTKEVIKYQCAFCEKELDGSGISCLKGHLNCRICSQQFETCPFCSLKAMKTNKCLVCNYTRQKCGQCGNMVDEAVWRLNMILCKPCSDPKPKQETYSSLYSYPSRSYDSPGCYNRETCKGNCTCDSTN